MGHNSDEQLFDPSRFSKPRRLSPQSLTLTRWVRIVSFLSCHRRVLPALTTRYRSTFSVS